jgi:hypothetical protein
VIGTDIGGAVPILITLAVQGLGAALIVLAYVAGASARSKPGSVVQCPRPGVPQLA